MIVTFISQCEKNALNKTRKVLDAFANRIGDKTWQTLITQEGLNAVRSELRKTASKNTAVSCHWLRGNNQTELVWVVGNRNKFNVEGMVPVNTTQSNIANTEWENDWHYMPLINALTALAALFHDWGKATLCFQDKLVKNLLADPLRHEWISCLLLNTFVHAEAGANSDENWLSRLSEGIIEEDQLKDKIRTVNKPLENLPPAASLIAWLVLSHHRLPLPKEKGDSDNCKGYPMESFQDLFKSITDKFGYANPCRADDKEKDYQKRRAHCFQFPDGLLSQSSPWLKQIKRWANKLQNNLALVEKALADGSWRLLLHHCRLYLMLGDHFYSSQKADETWKSDSLLYANTGFVDVEPQSKSSNRKPERKRELKQKLDEHLVHVAKNALLINHLLPAFETKLPVASDVPMLKKKSHGNFSWQDKAVTEIKAWCSKLPESAQINQSAFFTVNMASTGCGKTIANAKIMRALSADGNSLRYILALGLRTLTLQTGDEYRERIGLDDTELAVLIGSKAMMELHESNRKSFEAQESEDNERAGSESMEALLDGELIYNATIPEERLTTVLTSDRDKKFLYAPVLACTIDHIMGATETKRGGRYILPCLRLMSSDLVIDEVDDFDGSDLIAIGRLIHLAGMLGRKVMISSATIPPDLAEGYLNAYREGWLIYSKTRQVSSKIGCAWVDEFKTKVETLVESDTSQAIEQYRQFHQQFIHKRVDKLTKAKIRRKGGIIVCEDIKTQASEESLETSYFERIQQTLINKHHQHHTVDQKTQKKVSFGVVRIANIEPSVRLAQHLIQTDWEQGLDAKIMAYHSRQVLLLRSEQEKHLDQVLERKERPGEQPKAFKHSVIRQHLDNTEAENVIFIVVATPVEEIGRDHDFDWAVIEPSSFRSIIQLAGRVLRHRINEIKQANIALMQYNLTALKGKSRAAYWRPGYERPNGDYESRFKLSCYDLDTLLEGAEIENVLNAIPRIRKNLALKPKERLADLEHDMMSFLLTDNYERLGPETMQGWLTQCWWLTAIPQVLNPFRKSDATLRLYNIWDDGAVQLNEKDPMGNFQTSENKYNIQRKPIEPKFSNRLWLERDYEKALADISENQKISMSQASKKYGEINISLYGGQTEHVNTRYSYSDQFGLWKTGL